ncbi:MAG: glycine zipper 2TM domain-containing protein [Ketobacteraceae bacterium]|nr:glycine zipper 2TM domain-containing protein [Ketobacteraceae bacterium]
MNIFSYHLCTRLFAGLMAAVFSAGSLAETAVSYDYATVLNATPVTRIFTYQQPRQECWVETVERGQHREYSATGTLLGGVIGAAIGNKLGHKKRNKQMGAVAGALLGASIGNDISRRNAPRHGGYTEQVEKCRTVQETIEEERVVAYDVTYRYRGKTYHTRTESDPGDSLKLRLSVTPVE